MAEFLALLLSDPLKAVGLAGVFLSVFLIVGIYRRLQKDFEGFETTLNKGIDTITEHVAETKKALSIHADGFGRAAKAINGDMMKIREQSLSTREDFAKKLDDVKAFTQTLAEETNKSVAAHKVIVEKFGSVMELQERVTVLFGRVTTVEGGVGELRILNEQRHKEIVAAGKVLQSHENRLRARGSSGDKPQ